jgi:Ca2+-binding EF-hand superfamily protein
MLCHRLYTWLKPTYIYLKDAADTSHLFALFDTNADGKISFAEFVTALSVMTRGTPKQKLEVISFSLPSVI